jgi:hypothetical protein
MAILALGVPHAWVWSARFFLEERNAFAADEKGDI